MILRRTLWTAWALVPVGLLAFHIGPGHRAAARDVAARLQGVALGADGEAVAAQREAYATHLAAIAARRAAFADPSPDADAALEAAIAAETAAYEVAADLWEAAADQHEAVLEAATALPDADRQRIVLARGRALVRSGDVWSGAAELRELVDTLDDSDDPDEASLARAAREELAAAHYFGARILRLAGEPAADWRAEAALARQHYRHLARDASGSGADRETIRGFEDNVERVLDLEQQDQSLLEGMPLPQDSPRAARGSRPGSGQQAGKSRRPARGDQDARGASGVEQIGRGW